MHEAHRRHRVAMGEAPHTVSGLPLLTRSSPACGPMWRLFDGNPLPQPVKRQADALCVRCGVERECRRNT